MFMQTVKLNVISTILPTKFLFSPGYETSVMKIVKKLIIKTALSLNSSNLFLLESNEGLAISKKEKF